MGRKMPIRVVIADDNLLVRQGIKSLLDSTPDLEVVASCGDLDQLLSAVELTRPDAVLTDIRMPPSGTDEGIRAATQLRKSHPQVGVVVLSQYDDPAYALGLLEHGSSRRAYLLKERVSDPDQLVAALRSVVSGGSYVDPKVVEELVAARSRSAHSPIANLTPREREVLAEMAQGKNNAAIAEQLTLTTRAVEKHINSIFAKLDFAEEPNVDRRVKAVLLYLAEG
jgi:DNA-binding NarL/FixJ family response regulator